MKRTGVSSDPVPAALSSAETTRRGAATQAWKAYAADPLAVVGLAIVVLISLIAIFAPWISPADPTAGVGANRLLPPLEGGHLLGTDGQGRDVLTRLMGTSKNAQMSPNRGSGRHPASGFWRSVAPERLI